MLGKSKNVLILNADTPAGQAAKSAAELRNHTTIEINRLPPGKTATSVYKLDTSDANEVSRLDEELISGGINVDCLITCPATVPRNMDKSFYDEFQTMSESSWTDIILQNLQAAMVFCKVFSRHMLTQKEGRIIQLVSNVAIDPYDVRHLSGVRHDKVPGHASAAYTCAMAGVLALSRHLAADFGDAGVLINNIVYGPLREAEPAAFLDAYIKRIPSGRIMTAADLANAIDLLLDPDSSYITGQSIIVDGGVSIW